MAVLTCKMCFVKLSAPFCQAEVKERRRKVKEKLVLLVLRQIKGKKPFGSTSSQRTKTTADAQNTVKAYKVQMKALKGEMAYSK